MNLAAVCLVAFLTVMVLLSVLALLIRLLTKLFDVPREESPTVDAAMVAAIQAAVAQRFPVAAVIRIEPDA